jgi:heme-degrading monooxygenase HmoA
MIIERVEFDLIAGREEEFLRFARDHRDFFEGSEGCLSFSAGRGVEDPSKGIFLVGWDTIEAHVAVTTTPAFGVFRTALVGLVAGASAAHFTMVDPA